MGYAARRNPLSMQGVPAWRAGQVTKARRVVQAAKRRDALAVLVGGFTKPDAYAAFLSRASHPADVQRLTLPMLREDVREAYLTRVALMAPEDEA